MIPSGDPCAPTPKVLVIALGNPDRGDDGIGAIVAQHLAGRLPRDVPLMVRRGAALSLIDDWNGFDAIVCIDAAAPLGAPGRIHRLDLDSSELPQHMTFTSSHGLGLPEAIGLARALKSAPRRIIVYAIEGGSFDGGVPLTPAVSAAASAVAEQVLTDVSRLRSCTGEAAHETLFPRTVAVGAREVDAAGESPIARGRAI
jgi:hydrogenase maturation protease